jgi:AcrR family transcriptional regulator
MKEKNMAIEDVSEDGTTLSRREQISQRILEAAIELITIKGPQATTVRDITEMTGANVSAVNYYFRSKDELIQQALDAILSPVNAERRALLEAAQAAAAPKPASVEAILEALIRPMLTASRTKDGGRHYIRAVQHVRVSPGDPISVNTYAMNNATAQMFIDALAQALPNFTRAELVWRYEFARGAAIHLISNIDPSSAKMPSLLGKERNIDTSDEERILAEILMLTTAGLKQPPAWTEAELV